MTHRMTEQEYRPIYPDSPFIHIADMVNPATGLTYRQENYQKTHTLKVGALVKIRGSGLRLYVAKLGRDCDGTPLYWLSVDKPEELGEHPTLHGGYSEHSLIQVRRR